VFYEDKNSTRELGKEDVLAFKKSGNKEKHRNGNRNSAYTRCFSLRNGCVIVK
jgi:hypothetical protein